MAIALCCGGRQQLLAILVLSALLLQVAEARPSAVTWDPIKTVQKAGSDINKAVNKGVSDTGKAVSKVRATSMLRA
jgi:hypothetical protein